MWIFGVRRPRRSGFAEMVVRYRFPLFPRFPKFAEKLGVMVDSPEQGFSEGELDITVHTSLVEQLARPVRAFSTPAPRGGCLRNTVKTGFFAADDDVLQLSSPQGAMTHLSVCGGFGSRPKWL